MLMKVERLRNTLKLLQPVINNKTAIPIVKSVLLGGGKALATDLETAVWIDFPEATEPCLLPFKEVMGVLELVPGHLELSVESEKKVTKLSWDGGKAAYPTADVRDFPDIEQKDPPSVIEDVDGTPLISALVEMAPYANHENDDKRTVLHGVDLFLGTKAVVVGADGFRLAYRTLPFGYGGEGAVIIPPETINLVAFLWKKTPPVVSTKPGLIEQLLSKRMLTLAVGKDAAWIGFKFGVVKITAKTIVGNTPDYKAVIENNHPNNKVTVMAPDLYQAVQRCKELALAATGMVRLRWDTETQMEVYASAAEKGDVSTVIPITAMDGPSHVALKYRDLIEYLKGKDGQVTLAINTTSNSAPVTFEYSNAPTTIVMPLFAEWS